MHLKTLNAFLVTSELLSFSAASRYIGITPAAVSKSIGELEQKLGVRLFHRNTRNLSLTEDGKRLRQDIAPAIHLLDRALSQSMSMEQEASGKLKINIPDSFGKRFILPLIPEFFEQYPQIELDIHLHDKKVDPVNEGFDISIGNLDDADSRLVARELCRLQLVTVASAQYLSSTSIPKHPADLQRHRLIGYRQLSSGRVVNWRYKSKMEDVSISPNCYLTVSNIEAVVACVNSDLGIGCVGLWHVSEDITKGKLVELLPKLRSDPVPVKIYFPSRENQPRKVRVFIDFLLERKNQHWFD